ncbi:MAG: pyridine nucleotide-disulfide oxidoreductase [Alphaproteobacteria bacterium]|nr:pyridine nucleotide-disulfide oxidoreductase [Alphaproteobacteria bacterium]
MADSNCVPEPGARPLLVIVGMGETGVLTAANLPDTCDVLGITTKPCLISGQEVGTRLVAPHDWAKYYVTEFRQLRRLDRTAIVEAKVTGLDPAARVLTLHMRDGSSRTQHYDVLVIATGISNGFWRDDRFAERGEIEAEDRDRTEQLATAKDFAVIGGGPTAASIAANLAAAWPEKPVNWFHPGERPLSGYHPDTVDAVLESVAGLGVVRHAGHRAVLPEGHDPRVIGPGTVEWQTGQDRSEADAVIWATGAARPNSSFMPTEALDPQGYIKVTPSLQTPQWPEIFAIGDVAATDLHRSSARNWAYKVLAQNIGAYLAGKAAEMQVYKPPEYRWGSVVGVQRDGLMVYGPQGKPTRFRRWVVRWLLFPLAVRRGIFGGVRRP